jgi:CXXX repeat modification system protein
MDKNIVAVIEKGDMREIISLKERETSLNNLLLQLAESTNDQVLLEKVKQDKEAIQKKLIVALHKMLEKYKIPATDNVYLDFSTGTFKMKIEG